MADIIEVNILNDASVEMQLGAGGSVPAKWDEWNAETRYNPLNCVGYDGSSYICLKANSGRDPEADVVLGNGVKGEYWLLIAKEGAPFTYDMFTPEQLEALRGPQGLQGVPGKDGQTGPQGEPFTYDDFTPEQLEALRGPEGPAGQDGKDGDTGPAGKDGQPGAAGSPGADGVSPVVSVSAIAGGHRVTITDKNGTKIFDVMDGKDGAGGGGGGVAGEDGVTFYPYVDTNGNLSWTNNGGLDNPETVNIRGPRGLQGEPGKDGSDGQPGAAGSPGADGVSPVVSVSSISGGHRITITDKNGTKIVDVMNGSAGQTGAAGQPGNDGKNATINGVNALTIQGGDGIDATMSGSTLKLALTNKMTLMTAADYDAVTDWSTILKEGEIAWRCE